MPKFYVQNPTKRPVKWGNRKTEVLVAESIYAAATLAAQRKGPGKWVVNIATKPKPTTLSKITVRV